MVVSVAIAAATLFVVGAYKAHVTVGHVGRSGLEMAAIGTISAMAVYVVGLLFRVDDKIERRRKMAADAAKVLAEEGFELSAEACNQYAIGDYSGFVGTLRELVRQLLNPETRLALLRKPFRKQLVSALKDEEERTWVLKTIAEFEAVQAAKTAVKAA